MNGNHSSMREYAVKFDFEKLSSDERNVFYNLIDQSMEKPEKLTMMNKLLEKEFIYQNDRGHYQISNPIMEYMLKNEKLLFA